MVPYLLIAGFHFVLRKGLLAVDYSMEGSDIVIELDRQRQWHIRRPGISRRKRWVNTDISNKIIASVHTPSNRVA
jgi:hypothetical protein